MLYVLTGSDISKAKARAFELAAGTEIVRFGEAGEPFLSALGYIGAQGLFSEKVALILDRPSEDVEGKTLLEEHGDDFVKANMAVIVIEPDMNAAAKKKIPKGAEVAVYDMAYTPEEPMPSVFALTDAFTAGDRKNAWVLYRRLIEAGSSPEEVHGALTWAARSLVLASKTKSAEEAGLKPFVYSKAKRASQRFGEAGSAELSRQLVRLVQDSRSGKGNLEDLLEAFLLKKA